MTLLSSHHIPLHWGQDDAAQLQRIRPRSVKVVNQLEGRMREIQLLSPNSLFVYRDHPLSEQHGDMFHDPKGTGIRHADDWADKLKRWNHPAPDVQKIVLGINEPHVWEPDGIRITVLYTVAFLDRLTEYGIRGGALNLSVGWPANTGEDIPPNWEPYKPVQDAIRRGNHILFLHEYWPHEGIDYKVGMVGWTSATMPVGCAYYHWRMWNGRTRQAGGIIVRPSGDGETGYPQAHIWNSYWNMNRE